MACCRIAPLALRARARSMSAPLTDFAVGIVTAYEAATDAMRSAVAQAVCAGELLAKAKEILPHGACGDFCATLPYAATTARSCMRLAALDPANRQRAADLPQRTAQLELAEPRPLHTDNESAPAVASQANPDAHGNEDRART